MKGTLVIAKIKSLAKSHGPACGVVFALGLGAGLYLGRKIWAPAPIVPAGA